MTLRSNRSRASQQTHVFPSCQRDFLKKNGSMEINGSLDEVSLILHSRVICDLLEYKKWVYAEVRTINDRQIVMAKKFELVFFNNFVVGLQSCFALIISRIEKQWLFHLQFLEWSLLKSMLTQTGTLTNSLFNAKISHPFPFSCLIYFLYSFLCHFFLIK